MDGTWKAIHDRLREKARKSVGKTPTPTGGIIDSQSIRSAEGGEERGFDAAKKITGRKGHLIVDTMGFVLLTIVTVLVC
jgi:putative transposase